MKPFKLIFFLSIFTGIIITGSCQKEAIQNNSSFIVYVETGSDYLTKSCIQLTDGSYIILGIGDDGKSAMAKFSETGDLIWQKQLPGTLKGVVKGIPLPSGEFVLAGSDSTWGRNNSGNCITTITVYDTDGIQKRSVTINPAPSFVNYNHLDFTILKNGNLALCICPTSALFFSYPRLLILNQNLTTLYDQVYYASPGTPFKDLDEPHIQEAPDGSIYFCFTTNKFCSKSNSALMKLNADYSVNFFKDSVSNCDEQPNSFILDNNGNSCIVTAQFSKGVEYFYNEFIVFGNKVSVIRRDTSGNYLDRHDYSGFNQLGALMRIIKTRDGGFIMVGACNENQRSINISSNQVLLLKTDANLNQQWMKQINTTYPAAAYDIFETRNGGYAIGAFEKSFNKTFKMMIINVDANGNL